MSPIHFTLQEKNRLLDEGQCVARVHRHDPIELEALVDLIVQHGSTVGRADILSVLDDYHTTIENLLLLGMSINTPTAKYHVSVQGVFNDKADGYDPSRHRVAARVAAGSRLRKAIRSRAEVVKDDAVKAAPDPQQYIDVVSGTTNNFVTPGEGALLTGRLLRYDPADPKQGLFFVAADKTETRVERVIKVRPSEVSLIAPALSAGTYSLEARAALNGDAADIRTGRLLEALTVA
jgi:hypothetical protein